MFASQLAHVYGGKNTYRVFALVIGGIMLTSQLLCKKLILCACKEDIKGGADLQFSLRVKLINNLKLINESRLINNFSHILNGRFI